MNSTEPNEEGAGSPNPSPEAPNTVNIPTPGADATTLPRCFVEGPLSRLARINEADEAYDLRQIEDAVDKDVPLFIVETASHTEEYLSAGYPALYGSSWDADGLAAAIVAAGLQKVCLVATPDSVGREYTKKYARKLLVAGVTTVREIPISEPSAFDDSEKQAEPTSLKEMFDELEN